ncbi:MAG: hypothetical protein H3C43_02855 [Leptonema sp. (in: Bacteria)]|nr:hypothetical protein [Leptonema sp. (in: bacteria)]
MLVFSTGRGLLAESNLANDIALESVLPGYIFFKNNQRISGSFMLSGRVSTIAGGFYFYNRYINYSSAEKAAKLADLYYGPGLKYRDPYSHGYKSSNEFRKQADRNLNLSYYSIAAHLILLSVSIYNAILIDEQNQLDSAPVFDQVTNDTHSLHYKLTNIVSDHQITKNDLQLFETTIHLDF